MVTVSGGGELYTTNDTASDPTTICQVYTVSTLIDEASGIFPPSGSTAGGTRVMITGTGFTGATVVDFGTTAATNVEFYSTTQIVATSPAGTDVVDVTVVTPGGTSQVSSADWFTYIVPTVSLNWSGPGSVLNLVEDSPGASPAILIWENPINGLTICLGAGQAFANGSTISAAGLTYENPGSPMTSQYATIDTSQGNAVSSLQATLPGDELRLGRIRDLNGGIGSIDASAGVIEVSGAGIDTGNANGNVDLKATGNLTVYSGTIVKTGVGTISLAADVKADGTGDDGVGTLSIGAGAAVTSSNPTASAIMLRGADINIDTSANPAVVRARGGTSTTPTATLTGVDYPIALTFDSSGNLYVANDWGNSRERVCTGEHHAHRDTHRTQ